MSAVQGGVIVLSVGAHCGKPQSQSACSPQLEEEEDHGKTTLRSELKLYAETREGFKVLFSLLCWIQEAWLYATGEGPSPFRCAHLPRI